MKIESVPNPPPAESNEEEHAGRLIPEIGEKVWIHRNNAPPQEVNAAGIFINEKTGETHVRVEWQVTETEIGKKAPAAKTVLFVGKEIIPSGRTKKRGGVVIHVNADLTTIQDEKGKYVIETVKLVAPPKQKTEKFSITPELQELLDELWPRGLARSIEQGTLGDCYFLAPLDSIKNADDGVEVLSKIVKKNEDGSFSVSFPGDPVSGRVFTIDTADLEEIRAQGLKGSLGDQVLERAYARLRQKILTKSKTADDTGETVFAETDQKKMAITKGSSQVAFKHLLGDTHEVLVQNPDGDISAYLTRLAEEDPIAIQSGNIKINLGIAWKEVSDPYVVTDAKGESVDLLTQHAYSMIKMIPSAKQVIVADPHGKKFFFSFQQIGEYFDDFTFATKKEEEE